MKTKAFFGALSFCISIAALSGCKTDKAELTIFDTNDIHSMMRAPKADPFSLGGIAKLATEIKNLRSALPATAVSLTLDAGDWSEGTWFFSVDQGANMLRALDLMGYDAAALGNHDFLIGPDEMIKVIQAANAHFPVLAGNLDPSPYAQANQFNKVVLPYTIINKGGLRIGIIGLTTYELLYDSYLAPVKILNPVEAASKLALKLRPDVDVLIVVSHNSIGANKLYAQAIPGIDALISGHSHVKTPHAILVKNLNRNIPVVEAGYWGRFVGELKLTVDKGRHYASFESFQLHPITPDIPDDPQMKALVDEQTQKLAQRYGNPDEQVADAAFDMPHEDAVESPEGNLAVKAYRAETGADLSLEEISLTGVSLAQGPITRMDLHDVVPHIYNPKTGKEWELYVWNAKGSDLFLIFEVFYKTTGLMPLSSPLGWLSADNAQVIWDPSSAVQSISIGGKTLDLNTRYRVALHEGLLGAIRLANDRLHLGVDLSQVTNTGTEAWQAVINYAASVKSLTVNEFGVGGHTFTKGPDLAVFSYGINWDGSTLSVQVENQGLAPSWAAKVTCSSGLVNDPVSFQTSDEKWTAIGTQDVAPLAPSGKATLSFQFSGKTQPQGRIPFECAVSMAGEAYTANNSADHVFVNAGK